MSNAMSPNYRDAVNASLSNRPYLLLTPGPLSTTPTVRAAMLRDLSTWDRDYNDIVQDVRRQLVKTATNADGYTSVLMQGSGTFAVESTIGSVIPQDGKVLIVANGAYGQRMVKIADRLGISHQVIEFPEDQPADAREIMLALDRDTSISFVAMVHCETTTGVLNPAEAVGCACHERKVTFILDAMSSFGGIPIDVDRWKCDFLVSSANKCIQGVPGFGFVICRQATLEKKHSYARSLSLDLFEQWNEMERHGGKWRFTSPTHTLLAFHQALTEIAAEGGVQARFERYSKNQSLLVAGMKDLGFRCLVETENQSPVITSFYFPNDVRFEFNKFYDQLKQRGFVIYPGKVTDADSFRIGTIGDVFPADVERLVIAISEVVESNGWSV